MTIASEWPEPWSAMWSIASSSESTTFTASDQRQVLGVPVLVGGLAVAVLAGERAGAAVEAQLDALAPQRLERARQEGRRGLGVDEQRLGRVADARPLRPSR